MHEHDLDLIAAWAADDPTLSDEERDRAAALARTCPTCREEAELQRVALSALSTLPHPYLTDDERRRIHEGLRAAAPVAPRRHRRRRFARLLVPAAAALVVVVLVGIATLPRGGDESASDAASTMQAEAGGQALEVAPGPASDRSVATPSGGEENAGLAATEDARPLVDLDTLRLTLEDGTIVELLDAVAIGAAERCTRHAQDEATARHLDAPPSVAVLIETPEGPREAYLFVRETADGVERLLVLADADCRTAVLP